MKIIKVALWALVLVTIVPATAQERSLSWDALTVNARLDADGVLHVVERHAMVFDGPWNGGERSFQLRSWQALELKGMSEIHAVTQVAVPWIEGELDHIGRYQRNGNVVRWRARMPTDPPFEQSRKTYELTYALTGAVVAEGDEYLLEHDLAFPDRRGEIRVFDATLELDPVWQADGVSTRWHHENLQPGESVFARATLRHTGLDRPRGLATPLSMPSTTSAPALRIGLALALIAFAVAHAVVLMRRERARGRFEPTLPVERIDEVWLRANVFSHPPEVVGAAWDLDTSASEVAALLARLEQQGALKSRVETRGAGWLKRETLHMELLCDRGRLADHERKLIDALFFDGSQTTSTERIREHYAKSGFTPAALIKGGIERQLPFVFANRLAVPQWARWLTGGLFGGGVIAFVANTIVSPDVTEVIVISAFVLLFIAVFGLVFGYLYRTHVIDLRGKLIRVFICIGLLCGVVNVILIGGIVPIAPMAALAIALIAAGLLNAIFNVMRIRETADALAFRRQLGAARQYFERELRSKSPRLKDEWFPYLLAFGLGPHIDKWFKSFAAPSHSMSRTGMGAGIGTAAGASVAGSRAAPSAWTGGGGSFGGAGASATWSAAVGSIASGVAKPSSGGGRSSGGGSSRSSGGGGGGGW